ncbi:Membrane protein involved in the export of O-antigen and teichoic acid [Pilibacter termitis]|uniref:Membrane protein involved in the export of O-antigen and teichoic acid n=1 Tax=Pilibacter termitis TaxID=263852 RepID=A0A1T4M0P2_9ENTE|nr:polysaccharide biosynthesis protein [Pilibacter termitis]SJZ60294.1 Membrane protein involved in the export of O-antigen and teichoic acid [Pilibacter termitis]
MDVQIDAEKMDQQKSQMVRGSLWMAAGNLVSRLLGAVYIIPWYAWMGSHANQANGLFSMGYNIYALFLLISTAGIPGAVAKQTAKYNALNEYKVSRKLFFTGLKAMAVLGAFFALIMFLFAPLLANLSGGGESLVPVMRSLAIAVFVFPCMSVIRGFFQGNNQMAPMAVSQIIEQVARVAYMLLTAFIIMKVQKGDYVNAVVQSTFAAFIGMIASFAVLIWYLWREMPVLDAIERKHGVENIKIKGSDLLIETIRQSIPFIIVGSGVQLFKIVDQFTFSKLMGLFTEYSDKQLMTLFSIFSANPDKLTMVIIALATSLSGTGLPLITENYTLGKKRELATLVSNNLQLFFFIMLPSVAGMMILAKPLYTIFYTPDALGTNVLAWAALQSLFLGYYMLTSNMLQGMYQNRITVKYLMVGLVVKIIVQFPAVKLFEVYGPIISTFVGFGVSCYLITRHIRKVSRVNLSKVTRRTILLLILTLIMALLSFIAKQIFGIFLDDTHKFSSFILVMLTAFVGGGAYLFLSLSTRIADRLLGGLIAGLRRKLKMK